MKKLIYILPLIIFSVFSCQSDTPLLKPSENIVRISSGQSFGMCMGTCYNELIISGNKAVLKQIERSGERGTFKETVHERNANDLLPKLKNDLLNISADKFLTLQDRYGCPDCADGGMEWLEIELSDGQKKRVEFEYGSSVEGFEEIILSLRKDRLSLIEKFR